MFFVYSLNLQTLSVNLYSSHDSKDQAELDLHDTVINFIRIEEGDKKAQDPFRDDIPDSNIKEDGYFLRHSDTKNNVIDVFCKKTEIIPGNVWGVTVNTSINKVVTFSITEASINLPIVKPVTTSKKPILNNSKQSASYDNMIQELKEILSKRKLVESLPYKPVKPSNLKKFSLSYSDSENES